MNEIQKQLSLFQINVSVVQEYLGINKVNQQYVQQLVGCENQSEFRKIKKNNTYHNWEQLKCKLFIYFLAANQTLGRGIHKFIQEAYEDLLIQYRIFYEGIIEFQTCQLLNQYMICRWKVSTKQTNKNEFRQLINLIIWKSNQIHFIIRIIIGYVVCIKISKQIGNIEKVFQQVCQLIEKCFKNGAQYECLKEDVYLFTYYWNKIIKISQDDISIKMISSMLQLCQFHFNDYKFSNEILQDQIQTMQRKSRISIGLGSQIDDSKSIKQQKKPILQINNLIPEVLQGTQSSIMKPLKTDTSFISTKRIKTTTSRLQTYQNIEEDPFFQIQVENYHIRQILRKGFFKMKTPIIKDQSSQQRFKTQPTMMEEINTQILFPQSEQHHNQDSIVEQSYSPVKQHTTESEVKISLKEPSLSHSQSSQSKIAQNSNPYKLKNLISSRFQQILDIAQQSAQSTPTHEPPNMFKRQKTISIKRDKQQQIFLDPPKETINIYQSINEIEPPNKSNSNLNVSSNQTHLNIPSNQELKSQSNIQLGQHIPSNQSIKRQKIRRNVITLKTANTFFVEQSNSYIPKFKFILCYYGKSLMWEVVPQITKKTLVQLSFRDVTEYKIIYKASIKGVTCDTLKNWSQVINAFIKEYSQQVDSCLPYLQYNYQLSPYSQNNFKFIQASNYSFELQEEEISQMGLLKDLFSWLYKTYLYEEISITGIRLKLCLTEKDNTLNAGRELLNIIQVYKRMILNAAINQQERFNLLMHGYGECVQKNINILNRIFNFRVNIQKNKQYIIHKQFVNFKRMSIVRDEVNAYFILRVSIIIQKDKSQSQNENLLYFKNNDYQVKPLIDVVFEPIDSPIEIKPLKIQYEAIEKILENRYYTGLRQIVNRVFFKQRSYLHMIADFINTKLVINEQKQLQIKMNIFSLHDAQKMEACGMKLGFLFQLKTKVKPFAITEIERYIYDDAQKKLDYERKSQTIHHREHLFDKHFNSIFGDEAQINEQQQFKQSTLIDLVKKYRPNITEVKDELNKVGPIIVYQDNPFTDVHIDELEKVKSQFFERKSNQQIYKYRIGLKHLTLQINLINLEITLVYHFKQFYYKFHLIQNDEDDNLLQNTLQFIQNGPNKWVIQMLYRKVSQRYLKSSFMSAQLYDGLELLKYKSSKSQLTEIPSYTTLHTYILNNYLILLKYFTLKQFMLIAKIKNYGRFQIAIKVFFRCQKPDHIQDGDYYLLRIDFQNINRKTGMMKMIFNRYDIVDILKIDIPTQITDANIVQTVMNIFKKCHLGYFSLNLNPFFSFNNNEIDIQDSQITHNSQEDHSTKSNVQRIRRISNFPENSTFKKSELCKGFLEHHIKNSRLILTYVKKYYLIYNSSGELFKLSLNADSQTPSEVIIFQIYRHLLLDIWFVKVYVPKTTRQGVCIISNDDFKDNDNNSFIETLRCFENESYQDFTPRPSFRKSYRPSIFKGNNNSNNQSIQHSAIQLSQNVISHQLLDFFNLTRMVTEFTEYYLDIENKEQYILKEKLIWINIINNNFILEQKPKISNCYLSLIFDQKEIPFEELLFQQYIRIERIGESHIEFYMKYTQRNDQLKGIALLKGKINQMHLHKFPNIINEARLNEEQQRFTRRTCIFFPFDAISYANTSNFNIELKYFSYNKFTEVKEQINLRELLNLYIADGFFKYQTNYMNSKLNQSDVISICYYMIHKIKTQNFLNLSQYHTIPNLNPHKTKKFSHKLEKPIRSQIYIYKKPNLYTIKLLYNEVQVSWMNNKTCKVQNEVFSYNYLDEKILYFRILAEKHPNLALQRITIIIDLLIK